MNKYKHRGVKWHLQTCIGLFLENNKLLHTNANLNLSYIERHISILNSILMMESHYSNAIKIKFELIVRNKSFFNFKLCFS